MKSSIHLKEIGSVPPMSVLIFTAGQLSGFLFVWTFLHRIDCKHSNKLENCCYFLSTGQFYPLA